MAQSDPITTEVIRYELVSCAEEIKRIFKRTTTLAILYELNDFGISVYDNDYRLIADAPGLPIFSGSLDECVKSCVRQLGLKNLAPGDVIATSIPFDTGSQPADAALVVPVFCDGELIAFTSLKAHAGDLGAIDPYPTASIDMFQEGLKLPAVWLYRRGELVEDILRVIRANSRIPQTTANSFLAGASALRAGARTIIRTAQRYGIETFRSAIDKIISHGEAIARSAVERMPDGTWEIVDYMDSNGVEDVPVKISVKVTIRGSDFIVDLSDSAPQQRGPINSPLSGTLSAVRFAFKTLTTPTVPANEGHFRPVRVIAPPGSLYHAIPPAPTFITGWSKMRLVDLIPAAMATAIPDRATAVSGGDISALIMTYYDLHTGRGDQAGGSDACGLGAASFRDGQNAMAHHCQSCCCNVPVEVQETRLPVLVECYELRTDSGGPGKHRGGLGVHKDFRTFEPTTTIATLDHTHASPVKGIEGGQAGKFGKVVFFPGTDRELTCGRNILELKPGERVSLFSGGGAGWGNPLDRSPESVADDVRCGYVSMAAAERDYGVVVVQHGDEFAVNADATSALRRRLLGEASAEGSRAEQQDKKQL